MSKNTRHKKEIHKKIEKTKLRLVYTIVFLIVSI